MLDSQGKLLQYMRHLFNLAVPINGPECLKGKEADDDTIKEGMYHLLFIKSGNLAPKQLSVPRSMAYYIAQSRTGKIIILFL